MVIFKLLYLMPATRDGDIDLIASMTDAEFDGLMKEYVKFNNQSILRIA